MKKLMGILLIGAGLFVGIILVLANVDFNRLGKENAYVQITTADSVEETKLDSGEIMKHYLYKLPAYNEKGEMIEVEFFAAKELRIDAYLMLYLKKGDQVTSYDEVQLNEIPERVKVKLNGEV
ncbi:YxeA family protein [Alkalihalobacillus sp. 1P02AB]|uniref:YxeA family protein n=1 Tax=Alkalihalobacillus sp. 1P02AB TaxID=3132260 RepID=UPI0039A50425